MKNDFWEDEFSSYDIDLVNSKSSAKVEDQSATAEPEQPKPASLSNEETGSAPIAIEQGISVSSETTSNEEKVQKNKDMYDKLFAKVGKRDPNNVSKEDVEKAVAQIDECLTAASQNAEQPQQATASSPTDRRQAKKMRIFSKKAAAATDVFIAARTVGRCFIDVNQTEYYRHLGKHHFLTTTSMATRTFHSKWATILHSETAQQSRDAIDKILTSAERLAMSVAEVIDTFPEEEGAMSLLRMIDQRCDDSEFHSLEHTIQMVADMQE